MLSDKAMFRVGVAILIVLGAFLIGYPFPSSAQGPLVNGDFEDGWYYYWGWGTKRVPEGWTPYWKPTGPEREPEFKEGRGDLFPRRVHSGARSAQWFTWSGTHIGGLYQEVQVAPGSVVSASAYFQAWTSSCDDPSSNYGGSYWTRIGIDPTGGTDWAADTVVWSPAVKHGPAPDVGSYEWTYQEVEAMALGSNVTVFLRGDAEWAVTHNDCQVDDVVIEVAGPVATPTATPTSIPTPFLTPTPTPNPTATTAPIAIPSETPSIEPTPTSNPCDWETMQERILFLETALDWAMSRLDALEAQWQTLKGATTTLGEILRAIGDR